MYVAINGIRPFDLESTNVMSYDEKIAIMKDEIKTTIELIEGLGLGKE